MNNKERFEIAIKCLKDAKPLKEICVIYKVGKDNLKKHGLEDEIKIPKGCCSTRVYHFIESNRILDKYQCNFYNINDDYSLFPSLSPDKVCWLYGNKILTFELRYIEKANVFALCHYIVECPMLGTAKVDFVSALIITPDKHTKLYKVKSWEKVWNNLNCHWGDYYKFLEKFHGVPLNNSVASWNKTFGKLFPLAHLRSAEYDCPITSLHCLGKWIKNDEIEYKNTDKQKQINKLLELPLKEVTKRELRFRKGTEFGRRVFIERVKDDMICIRFFQRNDFTEEIFETIRFYIDKENTYFCQKNSFNQFVATSYEKENCAIFKFNAYRVILDKSSSFEGTIIDYYKDIIKSDIKADIIPMFLYCLYYPSFEKFWKQNFKKNIYDFMKSHHDSFDAFLEYYYGEINSSASSPRKILGINEYQLASIKQFNWDYQGDIIKEAKEIIGAETLPSLTNKQTDELFSMINKSHKYYYLYNFRECFKLLREMYSLKTAFFIANNLITMQRKNRRSDGCRNTTSFYRDYLTMIKEMEMTSIYRPQFKDADDIKRMHDEIFEIYNVKKTIIQNEKFAKRIEDLKKFEYTSGEFSVVAPTKAEDLANEGIKLHHCVKSYIGRVANGETNIVFIRENTDLEKPFFTVEITNDNTIQQVHGFGNRNANTEPGLTEFVEKWAKDKNLMLHDINKIR